MELRIEKRSKALKGWHKRVDIWGKTWKW